MKPARHSKNFWIGPSFRLMSNRYRRRLLDLTLTKQWISLAIKKLMVPLSGFQLTSFPLRKRKPSFLQLSCCMVPGAIKRARNLGLKSSQSVVGSALQSMQGTMVQDRVAKKVQRLITKQSLKLGVRPRINRSPCLFTLKLVGIFGAQSIIFCNAMMLILRA